MIKKIFFKWIDTLAKKDDKRLFFKLAFVFSVISLLLIIPIRIFLGCNMIELITLLFYSVFGLIFYFIGLGHVRKFESESNLQEEQIKKLYEMTITDFLTQIYNRNYLFEKLSELSRGMISRGFPVSLILFDIDNFKRVNDTHGHLVGDATLRKIAKVVDKNIRASDIFGRYGGEEFLIIAPNTNTDEAKIVADNVRKKVEETSDGITISLGVTQIISQFDIDHALKRADDAMYESKANGRNQITVG